MTTANRVTRLDQIVGEGGAELVYNDESGNPRKIQVKINEEHLCARFADFRNKQMLFEADGWTLAHPSDAEIARKVAELPKSFPATAEASYRIIASGRVITRYAIPGKTNLPGKFFFYRVSGSELVFELLCEALEAAGYTAA